MLKYRYLEDIHVERSSRQIRNENEILQSTLSLRYRPGVIRLLVDTRQNRCTHLGKRVE